MIFKVTEDEVDGGYSASVDCHFDDTMPRPELIRLHFVRDEVSDDAPATGSGKGTVEIPT